MTRILTGITPSGRPHIGNYFGMMKRTIELQGNPDNECFYFISDLHSFTTRRSADDFRAAQQGAILDWLALGVDPERSVFYRQSDVPAHSEAFWLLLCHTPMGLLQRAHGYKDKTAKGLEANAGLFTYPILMAADILLYGAESIPVGKDQKQHVEMARDVAQKWNHLYGDMLVLPEADIDPQVATVPGTDGAKMSKSYNNTIPIFGTQKEVKKAVMSIKTASTPLGEPMDPETCNVMALHRVLQNPNVPQLEKDYRAGAIGFGESKKQLLEVIWNHFAEARERRDALVADPEQVKAILEAGAKKANEVANQTLKVMRQALGL